MGILIISHRNAAPSFTAQQSNQIGQSRPADMTAVSVINPSVGQIIRVTKIFVANLVATNQAFRIFHDASGTTYDETTALFFDHFLRANQSVELRFDDPLRLSTALENIAVRSDLGDALNFTFYGQLD